MASTVFKTHYILLLVFVFSFFHMSFGSTRKLTSLWTGSSTRLNYHDGPLLFGDLVIDLIWYGKFNASQKAVICDFINSLSSPSGSQPSVSTWFGTIKNYYSLTGGRIPSSLSISLGNQKNHKKYPMGRSLTHSQIQQMASKVYRTNTIIIVLTAADVTVQGFCMICGNHGSSNDEFVFIWVGNSATQCPGQCAWPFHQPQYGPQTPPLIPPNGDVGIAGIIINIGSLIVGAITNPYGNGVYQGVANAPLEAASACAGKYAKGSYPGYPGALLVDPTTGASYNAVGVNNRKYCLPALFDPLTAACFTLV